MPDAFIFFDALPETSLSRKPNDGHTYQEMFEKRQNYIKILSEITRVKSIKAELSLDAVMAEFKGHILELAIEKQLDKDFKPAKWIPDKAARLTVKQNKRVKTKRQFFVMGKILKVAPSQISMCTGPSPFVDNTHSQLNLSHPHADVNRGWFEVNATKAERTVNTDWDMTIGPKFESLIEFKSIYNHIFQIQNWRESLFAQRIKNWMEMDGKSKKATLTNKFNQRLDYCT